MGRGPQRLVIDRDPLGAVARGLDGLGDYHGDRLADEARLVVRQHVMRGDEVVGSVADPAKANAFYHDNWWITDARRGIYSALGMNGQQLLIHRPSRTVVVKFSTHPGALESNLFALQDVGMTALCESFTE